MTETRNEIILSSLAESSRKNLIRGDEARDRGDYMSASKFYAAAAEIAQMATQFGIRSAKSPVRQ